MYCTSPTTWMASLFPQSDSQSKPRRGSPGKDVLGPGFQLEILHGNFQNNSDTSIRGKKGERTENQNQNQTKGEALKSYVMKWDAVKFLL